MKKTTVAIAVLTISLGSFAQGTFLMGNRVSAIGGTGAPVGYLGDAATVPGIPPAGPAVDRVAGNSWLAQIVVAGVPLPGTVVPFNTGNFAGFISNRPATIDGIAPGSTVSVQLAAWYAPLGANYAEALAMGVGGVGISNPVPVELKAATVPDLNPMTGLQSFNIAAIVPEPSIASLGLLGAAVLLLRRKK